MAMFRLKKNVVAAALAGSMVIALPGAAFATTVEGNGFTVDKTWTAASNTQLNNTEAFTFQIEFTGADKVGINTAAIARPELLAGDFHVDDFFFNVWDMTDI